MIPEFGITLGAILGLASFISILGGQPCFSCDGYSVVLYL